MNTLRVKKLLVTLALPIFLMACGSGELVDNSSTIDSAANLGLTSAAANTSGKIQLTGHVMGQDIANAQVMATIGGKQYNAPVLTDSTGAFTIEVDPAAASDLVKLEAVNPSTGLHWVLVSGSYDEVSAKAAAGVVEDLDLWTVSTASFALAKTLASDSSIDSATEYEDLLAQASSEEITNIAAALQILTNRTNGLTVPSGYADYLQLALDIASSTSSFLADVETLYPGTIESTKQQIFANTGITSGFEANRDAGVYVSYDQNTLYALYAPGNGVASFFDDGFARDIDTWTVTNEGDLVLDYAPQEQRVDRLRLLNNSEITLQTLCEKRVNSSSGSEISPATFDFYRFAEPFTDSQVPGTYSVATPDASAITLTAGGGGEWMDAEGNLETPVTWKIDGIGRLVITKTLVDETIVLSNLESGRLDNPVLLSSVVPGGFVQYLDVIDFK